MIHRLARPDDPVNMRAFSEHGPVCLVSCPICNGEDVRQDYLRRLCGLRGGELDADFDGYWLDRHGPKALDVARSVLERQGWLTLHGDVGTGKTYLLTAIVNEGRRRGLMAIYSTMSNLLDHLRRAYKPGAEVDFDALWVNILRCRVLCLDEAEKFNATSWADEKFNMMIDERYRRWPDTVTVLATNSLEDVPGYLKSRAMDGRFKIVFTGDRDVRPGLRR